MNRAARILKVRYQLLLATSFAIVASIGLCFTFSDSTLIKAALFLGIACYLLVVLMASLFQKENCIIHPYFSKKLSSELPRTAFNGNEIGAHLDELDARLIANRFKSISSFGFQQTAINKMHRPEELLRSLEFLFQSEPVESQLRAELYSWLVKLRIARDEGAFVAIHIRITDGVSGCEIDILEGGY